MAFGVVSLFRINDAGAGRGDGNGRFEARQTGD